MSVWEYIKYFEDQIENEVQVERNYENLIVLYDYLRNPEKVQYCNLKLIEIQEKEK